LLKQMVKVQKGQEKVRTVTHDPFKRGVMKFDDYNYSVFNKYVLVKET